jgi:hypothetical protein
LATTVPIARCCLGVRSGPISPPPNAAIVASVFGRNFDPSGTDAEFAGCLSVRPIPSPQAPRAWPDRTRAQLKAAPFPCHGGRPLVFLPILFNSTRSGVGTHKGLGNVALDRGRRRVAVISKNARRPPTERVCESSPCRLISATDANGSSWTGGGRWLPLCYLPMHPRNLRINLFCIAHIKPAKRAVLWR